MLAAVPVVVVSLVAFLLVAAAVGVATCCVWLWRTVSPAPGDRSDPLTQDEPAVQDETRPQDEALSQLSWQSGPTATPGRFTLARDRTFGYDL